jgi:hypothetical protein
MLQPSPVKTTTSIFKVNVEVTWIFKKCNHGWKRDFENNVKKNHTKILVKHNLTAKIALFLPAIWFVICQFPHV